MPAGRVETTQRARKNRSTAKRRAQIAHRHRHVGRAAAARGCAEDERRSRLTACSRVSTSGGQAMPRGCRWNREFRVPDRHSRDGAGSSGWLPSLRRFCAGGKLDARKPRGYPPRSWPEGMGQRFGEASAASAPHRLPGQQPKSGASTSPDATTSAPEAMEWTPPTKDAKSATSEPTARWFNQRRNRP